MARAASPRGTFRQVRRFMVIALVFVAGCGSTPQRENLERPAPPVVMTAVSPRTIGAGQIELVVSNQSDAAQTVTFETDELGGRLGGNRASTSSIPAGGTGRLKIDAREGVYAVRVEDDAIRAARVRIGPPRESGQNQLLLP